jgi:uncharacterized membrane protein
MNLSGVEMILILLRWGHFLFGITWIGLLYYFNFVQTPFFGETEAGVRSGAVQKLVPRALWWFRWGAMGTVVFGLAYLLIYWGARLGWSFAPWTVAIFTGGALGLFMWGNVWFCIWPNQKIVIASATAVAKGGQADPRAAAAGRRGALASRTNVLFSIPMLFFMGSASHYPLYGEASGGGLAAWAIITSIIVVAIEINALMGTQGPTKRPLDTIPGVITSGFVLWAILTIVIVGTLSA